jgi:hypothetical protein
MPILEEMPIVEQQPAKETPPRIENPVRAFLLPVSPEEHDEYQVHLKVRQIIEPLRKLISSPLLRKTGSLISEPGFLFVYRLITSFMLFAGVAASILGAVYLLRHLNFPLSFKLTTAMKYIFMADLALLFSSVLRGMFSMLRDVSVIAVRNMLDMTRREENFFHHQHIHNKL